MKHTNDDQSKKDQKKDGVEKIEKQGKMSKLLKKGKQIINAANPLANLKQAGLVTLTGLGWAISHRCGSCTIGWCRSNN